MQRNRRNSGILTNQTRVNVCQQIVVQSDAKLTSHWNAKRSGSFYGCLHDFAQQILLQRHRRTTATTRNFWRRATKIQVDVIYGVASTQLRNRIRHDCWVTAIKLQTAKRFVRTKRDHCFGLWVFINKRRSHHHFIDINKARPKFATQRAKRLVRHPSHRCQNNRRPNAVLAKFQWLSRY